MPWPAQIDEAVGIIRQVADTVAQQPGSKGTVLLLDSKTGKALGAPIWDTQAQLLASATSDFRQQQLDRFADLLSEPPSPGELYEIRLRA